MVFQSYALYPHLSVRDNMALGLKQEKQPKSVIEERVGKAVEMLDLGAYVDRRPSDLSGGQRQRVAIGRAIVREPKLFLFDEPLSNLDAALRMNTRIEIAELHRTLKATVVYVTHDQTEAMTLADKIVVLRDGRVEQVGSPMELYNNPVNKFVAGFLGSPAMNFLQNAPVDIPQGATLGIRPESLRLEKGGRIKGTVTHVERLGGDTNLLISTAEKEAITVRLFGQDSTAVGEAVELDFDNQAAFAFDENNGRIEVWN
jgi:multiple sugar transport system ATP-binding protein